MAVIELPELPSVGATLLGSMTTRKLPPRWGSPPTLPEVSISVADHAQSVAQVAAYNRVCGFTLRDQLAPTWLHVLTFGLQTTLMARADFPFSLAGLVHVSNDMELLRPVAITERLHLSVRPGAIASHKRGAIFEVIGEVRVGTELVWTGTSSYLARGAAPAGAPERQQRQPPSLDLSQERIAQSWRLAADLGRRYAAVSGDVNPIHLSPVTARMFGFKAPLAHGMWTHARAVAALTTGRTGACRVSVDFTRPIFLPSTVSFATRETELGQEFAVVSRQGKTHLTGRMTSSNL